MTLKNFQDEVDGWIRLHGVRYFGELTNTLLLVEEVGELSRMIAREFGEQSYKEGAAPTNTKEAIADEMADVLFVLVCLANQMGIDLTTAIALNLEKKTSRDRDRHRNNPKLM